MAAQQIKYSRRSARELRGPEWTDRHAVTLGQLGVEVTIRLLGTRTEALMPDDWLADFNGCCIPYAAADLYDKLVRMCTHGSKPALPMTRALELAHEAFIYCWNATDRNAALLALDTALRLGGLDALQELCRQETAA